MKTDEELKKIATDLLDGKIFCDRQVTNPNDIAMVFMPIVLGAFSEMKDEVRKDIGFLYEYIDKAGPRAVNGMPCFFSVRYLNKEETAKMFKFYEDYKALKDNFMAEEKEKTEL
jgi:predicted nucleotidyltransferase